MSRFVRWIRKSLLRQRETWVDAGSVDEFPSDAVRAIEIRGVPVAVFHSEHGLDAVGDVCPHMGAALSDGTLHEDGSVECPAHRMKFHLKTGVCSYGPIYSIRVFRTRVENGRVYVRA